MVTQQLGLPSGTNLWEAFLYLQKIFEEKFSFTFKFTFELSKGSNASIILDEYDTTQKVFCFKITCNETFSKQEYSEDSIREINMLFRPCLTEINGKYYLREQSLPFFITLAHELLHALNQLERILYIATQMPEEHLERILQCRNDIIDCIEDILPIQVFLEQKLHISPSNFCLQEKYKQLWQNDNADDSLNEMTVILCSLRETEKGLMYIGETTLLREYYNDPTIVSWTHSTAHSSKSWKDDVPLLGKDYVEAMQQIFPVVRNIEKFTIPAGPVKQAVLDLKCGGDKMDLFFNFLSEEVLRMRECFCMIRIDFDIDFRVSNFKKKQRYWQFIVFPQQRKERRIIRFLPVFSELNPDDFPKPAQTNFHFQNYTLVDVPADGNCAFTAVKVALGDEKFKDKIGPRLTSDQPKDIKALREATADLMQGSLQDRPHFIQMLRQPGFWNNGIDGAVGIEVLSFVAQAIKQPILLITQEFDGSYRYWVSGPAGNPCDGNLALLPIQGDNIENILNNRPDAIKLFHNGIHFQAIIEQGALPPPPQPSHS